MFILPNIYFAELYSTYIISLVRNEVEFWQESNIPKTFIKQQKSQQKILWNDMRCFLPSWSTQTKSDHSRQQSRNHLGPPAIENCVPDKVFIFVYFWTGTVMLGSLACVPVNYVHRQPALFLHKVILTIYFSDISRYIKSLKIFQDIF